MNNPEKLATKGTQDTRRRKWKLKHNTICVGHHYTEVNTNNINKTWALLQTTRGKERTEHRFYAEIVMCVSGVDFVSFYDYSNGFWTVPTMLYFFV
jgi:hypothetical protein